MSQKLSTKAAPAFIWNIIGSSCYSLSSILFLMIVTRICGARQAGFFSLSYATAQLLLAVGRYGMRTFQATDLREQFSFKEYIVSRCISVGFMMLLGVFYSLFSFPGEYILISVLVIAMKAIDAVEDVYHGRLQQVYRVEQMGKAQAIRNIYTTICFAAVLIITKNMLITLTATVTTSIVVCIGVNQFMIHRYARSCAPKNSGVLKSAVRLLMNCTGIFIGTFLSLLLFNIPKYAMAGVLSEEYQTYYSILFMPSFVITLLCEFVFKPTITSLADLWFAGERKRFGKTVLVIFGILIACSVFIVFAGHFIGRYLLELLYGVNLEAFKLHFIVLLLGGGISSCVYMSYNILIAIRHGRSIKIVYTIVAVISILVVRPMINAFSMMGAALNYLLSATLLLVFFVAILLYIYKHSVSKKNTQ